MTDKAYIVVNEEQELRVLNEFEKRGYCWINDQGKPISSGLLIARELGDYPLFIGERFETKTIYWQDLSKLVNEEIVYDGRKEKRMSEKYVVSQEFMNELEEWKKRGNTDVYFVGSYDISMLPDYVKRWWNYPEINNFECNNRLIAIIRWVNGEDVFEVEKPKKWVVRSKETDDDNDHWYVRLPNNIDGINNVAYIHYMSSATLFDTKEEAESWANSHQEVVEVVDV